MSGYRDTTFCASEVAEHTCGREFTEQDAINAEKWWGGKDYPVAYSEFCEEAEMGDSLDEILERYRLHANMAYSEVEDSFRTAEEFKTLALPKVLDGAKEAIKAIIRTEKLNLLAEVRERVVGEDDEQSLRELSRDMPYEEARGLFETNTTRNVLRGEQRNLLTKLEAEL